MAFYRQSNNTKFQAYYNQCKTYLSNQSSSNTSYVQIFENNFINGVFDELINPETAEQMMIEIVKLEGFKKYCSEALIQRINALTN